MILKKFQTKAIQDLFHAFYKDEKEIILKSATGSGKTIILSTFLSKLLLQQDDYVAIWLTPGSGDLEVQSKNKMEMYYPSVKTKNLREVLNQGFIKKDVCYINWESVNKEDNISLRSGDDLNLKDYVKLAHVEGLKFIIIIDESHSFDTLKSDVVLKYFEAGTIIRASATPNIQNNPYIIDIPESVVIAEGLIKKRVYINQDMKKDIVIEDQVSFLIDLGLRKKTEISAEYRKIGKFINPLVLIQLPNNEGSLLKDVETSLNERGYSYDRGNLAIWLDKEKRNLDNLETNFSTVDVLIFKQAIVQGWDCPRSHVLVKLRGQSTDTFEIQTVGRIRRMPEAKHYDNELLDNAFIYSIDNKFVDEVKNSMKNVALEAIQLEIKKEIIFEDLIKEERSYEPVGMSYKNALNAIYTYYIDRYQLGDLDSNHKILEANEYIFKDTIVRKTIQGDIAKIETTEFEKLNTIEVLEPLNTNQHGRDFHHILSSIGSQIGLSYENMRLLFRNLFEDSKRKKKNQILKLSTRSLYSFLINNESLIQNDFLNAIANINQINLDVVVKTFKEVEFTIPKTTIFTYDASSKSQRLYKKNVYDGYLSSAAPRSFPEQQFERYINYNPLTEWFYKNGDKGQDYFSIGYIDAVGNHKLFYPDYILKVNKVLWIIETKGGFTRTGTSEDIDIFSPIKFEFLKKYGEKHSINIGFVKKDKKSNELLIATNKFDSDVNSEHWKLIDDVLGGQ